MQEAGRDTEFLRLEFAYNVVDTTQKYHSLSLRITAATPCSTKSRMVRLMCTEMDPPCP